MVVSNVGAGSVISTAHMRSFDSIKVETNDKLVFMYPLLRRRTLLESGNKAI